MREAIFFIFLLLAGFAAQAQTRPPFESIKVTAIDELEAKKTLRWRTDTISKADLAYVEWSANCFRFKKLAAGSAWSDWICAQEGESTTVGENAVGVLQMDGSSIEFTRQGAHSVVASLGLDSFAFKGTVRIDPSYTAIGALSSVIGYDTIVYGADTTLIPVFDQTFKNVVLLGHNTRAHRDSTAVIGDSTINQLRTAGYFNGKGLMLEDDTLYLRHLLLEQADSGKIAMHLGNSVGWVDDVPDSLFFQGAWYSLGQDSINFPDSIQINGDWVQLGGSVTINVPDAQTLSWNGLTGELSVSEGNTVDLDGRYLQTETPQNLSWDGSTGALGIDGGTGVDLDGRYLQTETPQNLSWDSETRELSIDGGNTVMLEDECACSGATGTFYSNEGKLITVENGLIKSIGEQLLGGYWTFKTISTSSTWSPEIIQNTGTVLHWEVTGAVTASADANYPVFDFSNAGEKMVTVTSADGMAGLRTLDLGNKGITEFNSDKLTTLATLALGGNNLTTFEATGMEGLTALSLYFNQLPTSVINSILDSLISVGNGSGRALDIQDQVGGGCGDPAKIQALDAIWDKVLVDTCAVIPEVTIGTQTWMSVNLDVDDGLGGIYAYDNNEANVATYGRLYTWDAAVRVAASIDGWRLPGDAEWTTLITYFGSGSATGGKLKETGTTHWASPNTGATNETGFTALPGGYRNSDGTFDGIGYLSYWWNAADVVYSRISNTSSSLSRNWGSREVGYSVRLIKNTP